MSMLESEFHFLLVCPRYNDVRRDLLPSTAWPSVVKFISIMATNSKMFLLKLSKFIKSANTLRSQTLGDLAILKNNVVINLLSHDTDGCKDDVNILI